MTQKPPLGARPKYIVEMERMKELARAINDYVKAELVDNTAGIALCEWCAELRKRVEDYGFDNCEKPGVTFDADE